MINLGDIVNVYFETDTRLIPMKSLYNIKGHTFYECFLDIDMQGKYICHSLLEDYLGEFYGERYIRVIPKTVFAWRS